MWILLRRRPSRSQHYLAFMSSGAKSRWFHASKHPVDEIHVDDVPHGARPLTQAVKPYFTSQQPLVVRQALKKVPAVTKWHNWKYFQQVVDMDTACFVEVGGNYSTSERAEIRFGDFLLYLQFFEEQYGRSGETQPDAQDLVYMAQNDLIPGLETDIEIPAFCSELGEGKLYSVMIWLGPYGCLSPLHFDPLDNVLMQFVGTKRVLLYPPGTQVYAGELDTQTNTSPINFDGPLDLSLYPLLKDLPPALECTITPGDFVFIPKRWWHQVVTVETSASVNVWWR